MEAMMKERDEVGEKYEKEMKEKKMWVEKGLRMGWLIEEEGREKAEGEKM